MAEFMGVSSEDEVHEDDEQDYDDEECTDVDDGDENYTYESDDEGSLNEKQPSLERACSRDDGTFFVPEGECVFVNYKDMYPNMSKLVMTVSSLLNVSSDVAELLLQEFKWNQENLLAQYLQNPSETLVRACVKIEQYGIVSPTNSQACLICMENFSEAYGPTYSLSCGHVFHRSCYAEYVESCVSDGPSCVGMTCPQFQCPLRISSDVVQTLCRHAAPPAELNVPAMGRTSSGCIVPWGSQVYESFVKHLVKKFIDQSSYMRWCPAPGCVFISVGRGVKQVTCPCSFEYCTRCQKPAHMPAPCEMLQKWDEKNKSESDNLNWLIVHTKPCPKCNTRIEKNQGCNHMTCSQCRHGFCWICMGNWDTHGGSLFSCNKFEGKDSPDIKTAKFELDRLMHNFTRFENHKKACTIAKTKLSALVMGAFPASTAKSIRLGPNSLKEAFAQVVECRRTLQYSYIVGHFAEHGTQEHQLFEFQQQMLESNTEALNHLTEQAEKSPLSEEDMAHVVNLTGVTKKFMSLMISADDMPMRKV